MTAHHQFFIVDAVELVKDSSIHLLLTESTNPKPKPPLRPLLGKEEKPGQS